MRQFGCPLGIELMLEEPAGFGRGERELVGEHFRRGEAAAGQAGLQIVEPHGERLLDNGMGDRRLADAEGIGKGPVEMLGHLQGGVEFLDQEGPGLGFDDVIDRPFPVQALRQQPVEIGFGILAQTLEGKADGPVADFFHGRPLQVIAQARMAHENDGEGPMAGHRLHQALEAGQGAAAQIVGVINDEDDRLAGTLEGRPQQTLTPLGLRGHGLGRIVRHVQKQGRDQNVQVDPVLGDRQRAGKAHPRLSGIAFFQMLDQGGLADPVCLQGRDTAPCREMSLLEIGRADLHGGNNLTISLEITPPDLPGLPAVRAPEALRPPRGGERPIDRRAGHTVQACRAIDESPTTRIPRGEGRQTAVQIKQGLRRKATAAHADTAFNSF